MSTRIVQVDAFTSRPFTGNPAGVCILDAGADEAWMQAVASEMNLAETAFLHPEGDGFRLRWFTPAVEVDLCGHATLASAHVLWEDGRLDRASPARFHTRSGLLSAATVGDWIAMDFPATPPEPITPPPGLDRVLGVEPVWTGRSRFDLFVLLGSEHAVREMAPDLHRIQSLPFRGVIVTASSESMEDADFVSRFFAPKVGVPEDPVTGSAHCALGPYWADRLAMEEVVGYQASRRGGFVRVRPQGERVTLIGQAVTTLRGELVS